MDKPTFRLSDILSIFCSNEEKYSKNFSNYYREQDPKLKVECNCRKREKNIFEEI